MIAARITLQFHACLKQLLISFWMVISQTFFSWNFLVVIYNILKALNWD